MALSAGFRLLVAAIGLGGVILRVRSVRRWGGGWPVAAAIPCALMAFVVLGIVIGVMLDPTSHNLWPFEILYAAAASLVYLGAVALARRFVRA